MPRELNLGPHGCQTEALPYNYGHGTPARDLKSLREVDHHKTKRSHASGEHPTKANLRKCAFENVGKGEILEPNKDFSSSHNSCFHPYKGGIKLF